MHSRQETIRRRAPAALAVGNHPDGMCGGPVAFPAAVLPASCRAVALPACCILHAFCTHSAPLALCSSPAVDCSSLVAAHSPGAVRVGLSSGSSCGSPSATVGILHHSAPFHTYLDDLAGRRARSGRAKLRPHAAHRRRPAPQPPRGASRPARAPPRPMSRAAALVFISSPRA